MGRPSRLSSIPYRGPGAYFVTTCTKERSNVFVDQDVVHQTLRHFLQSAEHTDVEVSAYCFMPDHLHLLIASVLAGDLDKFMRRAKQMSGYAFAQATGQHLWQTGYHDRALRSDDEALTVIAYMVANPVRRGFVERSEDWPFWGATSYSRVEVLEAIAMRRDRNWRG